MTVTCRAGGPDYVGEVEFVSQEEWNNEFDSLLDDLTTQVSIEVL